MIELNMSIHTTASGESQVTTMAKFDSQADAVRYHALLSDLANDFQLHKNKITQSRWPTRLLSITGR